MPARSLQDPLGALAALVSNPEATHQRIAELKAAQDAASEREQAAAVAERTLASHEITLRAAMEKLASDRADFEREVDEARGEIKRVKGEQDERETRLKDWESHLVNLAGELDTRQKAIADNLSAGLSAIRGMLDTHA